MTTFTASYSPDDNKLRLYASQRLDAETYTKAKSVKFQWAPKQGLFYATWNPAAEDFCLELAGEIGDEDTSLVERAAKRDELLRMTLCVPPMTPEKIKELRKSLAETQAEFGARLGIGWLAVHRLEKGTTTARGAVLKILENIVTDAE